MKWAGLPGYDRVSPGHATRQMSVQGSKTGSHHSHIAPLACVTSPCGAVLQNNTLKFKRRLDRLSHNLGQQQANKALSLRGFNGSDSRNMGHDDTKAVLSCTHQTFSFINNSPIHGLWRSLLTLMNTQRIMDRVVQLMVFHQQLVT